ncbi:MAG: FixH family protein [Candidatus Rokubacteria bacterium]|nr:FixH family protein [Candidatus Rokubacteria bacterium]
MIKAATYFGGPFLLAAFMTALLIPLRVGAGPSNGHATITLTTVPDRPVAAEDTRLTIVLKDKGQQPISNAPVLVRADMVMAGMAGMQHGSAGPTVTAKPSETPGEYLATLRLADPGDWRITVTAGHSTAEFKITALPPQPKNSAAARPSTVPASQRLGADEGQVATAQGKQVTKGHDDGHGAPREAAGPNYYFVGSTLGVVLITIAMVPILRRRSSRVHRGEAA